MDKNKLLQGIIFVLFVGLLCAGCMPRYYGPPLTPIEDPSKPMEFSGFSVLPPQGGEWKLLGKKSWFNAAMVKHPLPPKKGLYSFAATVFTYTVEENLENRDDFLEYVKDKEGGGKNLLPGLTLKESEVKIHEIGDTLCVRCDNLLENRRIPGHKGSVFLQEDHGISCRHPNNRKMIINLLYSQCIPPGMNRMPLEEEGEPFLNSISFTPLEKPFVTSMIYVGASPQQITSGHGSIWVAVSGENSVARIDPETNKVEISIPVGRWPVGVEVTKDAIWVTNMKDNTISRIDPKTNRVTKTIKVGELPLFIKSGFDSIWISNSGSNTISRLNPETNMVEATIKVAKTPQGIALGEDAVWVANGNGSTISKINPQKNMTIGEEIFVGKSPFHIVFWEDAIWVTTSEDNSVARVDPKRNVIVDRIRVGNYPNYIAIADETLWVTDGIEDTIVRIDPKSNELLGKPILVGSMPITIHYSEGALWVSIKNEGRVYRLDM